MKKSVLRDIYLCERRLERLPVFLDDNGTVILLPLLYSAYTSYYGYSISKTVTEIGGKLVFRLEQNPIGVNTVGNYMDAIFRFLVYVNDQPKTLSSVHQLHLITGEFINQYLNHILPTRLSIPSLSLHCAALKSFFNFLAWIQVRPLQEINLSGSARRRASENITSFNVIEYVSKENRTELLLRCDCKRDRLILRMGFELGLRSSELQGIRLTQTNPKHEGLLSLFEQMHQKHQSDRTSFSYTLSGRFTKGGKSRTIFFSRDLLLEMYDYFGSERLKILISANNQEDPPDFFLRTDGGFKGVGIGPRQASNTFTKYRKQFTHLNPHLGFHSLRHTFGTELYHEQLKSHSGLDTRSGSAALLTVAIRLGHSLGKNGMPQPVTSRYIRLREQMLEIEEFGY